MSDPITPAEKEAFRALLPVYFDPATGTVRMDLRRPLLNNLIAFCPRSARILAQLLIEEASEAEAANVNRDGSEVPKEIRPTF